MNIKQRNNHSKYSFSNSVSIYLFLCDFNIDLVLVLSDAAPYMQVQFFHLTEEAACASGGRHNRMIRIWQDENV